MLNLLLQYNMIYMYHYFSFSPNEGCEWSHWSEWSSCTVTCDGGKQVRSRVKIPTEHAGDACVGDDSEERDCNTDPCNGDMSTVYPLSCSH